MVIDLVAGQVNVRVRHQRWHDGPRAGWPTEGARVARASRSPLAPEVPTIAESGYSGFRLENYTVMLAPAGIAEPIAELLQREVAGGA